MGASWLTTVFGAITILGDVAAFVAHFMGENPAPITAAQWISYATGLAMGIGLIVAKSFNVSNSQHPAAPTVVSSKAMATANPSAVVPKP